VQVLRLLAAARLDTKPYAQALDDYHKLFQNDPTADLLSIDAFFLRGEHDKSLAAIDRLDKAVGGDPYLDVMRGNILFGKGDADAAKRMGARAVKADPSLYAGHDLLLSIALKQNDHPETARRLAIFQDRFNMDFGDLSGAEGMAAFRQSPEYKAWLNRQRGAAAEQAAQEQPAPAPAAAAKNAPAKSAPAKAAPAPAAPRQGAPAQPAPRQNVQPTPSK
jgi:predicted Zn-dependent protease